MTGAFKKLHNGELYNLYSLSNIIRLISSRRMTCLEHVMLMGEMKNVYKILVSLKGKNSFEVLCVDSIIIFKRMLQQRQQMARFCGLGLSRSG
jgi:predicted CopG family antitoxin